MAKNDETKNVDAISASGITKAYYEEQGAKTRKQIAEGGQPVTVDLLKTTKVRFTKAIGAIPEGHEQELSDVAYAIYDKQGVIEKVN